MYPPAPPLQSSHINSVVVGGCGWGTQVRSVPVTVHPAELSALNVRPPKVDQLRSVEASLRLDAVASAGFRIPRSKCADAIKNGCAASSGVEVKGAHRERGLTDASESDQVAAAGGGAGCDVVDARTKTPVTTNSDVKVNWREVSKASREVAAGDVISCRGKGRLEIGDVSTTAKGRYAVEMTRFV